MTYHGGEPSHPNKPDQLKDPKNIRNIVIHHSAASENNDINWFVNHRITSGAAGSSKYSGLGYNAIVFPNTNTIVDDVPEMSTCWSVGGYNSHSLSICASMYAHPPFNNEPTPEIISLIVQKATEYCTKYHLTSESIIGHRNVAEIIHNPAWATVCPGDLLYAKLPEIRQKVQDNLNKSITTHAHFEELQPESYITSDEDWGDMGVSVMH